MGRPAGTHSLSRCLLCCPCHTQDVRHKQEQAARLASLLGQQLDVREAVEAEEAAEAAQVRWLLGRRMPCTSP